MLQDSEMLINIKQNGHENKSSHEGLSLSLDLNSIRNSLADIDHKNSISALTNQNNEDNQSNIKISTFGRNSKLNEKIVIDFNKKEVNLQNSEDQQALIQILKKEVRNKKEIQFIDRLVGDLKFFNEKKEQLSEKVYGKLLEKLRYQYFEKEKPLFLHGDKGDKYYIVLKGSLALLLPPQPFEQVTLMNEDHQAKLKEKYMKFKDHPELLFQKNPEDQLSCNSPGTSSSRNKANTVNGIYVATALKMAIQRQQTPKKAQQKASGSSPSSRSKQTSFSFRVKPSDFESEKENNIDNIFDLYCYSHFPNYKQQSIFLPGTGFGEIALLRNAERSGTVVSKEDCHLMTLDKDSFDDILGRQERQKTDDQLNFLRNFAFFKEATERQLMGLLPTFKHVQMIRNEIIYSEDDQPENFYIIEDGEIELSKVLHIKKTETLLQQLEKEEVDNLKRFQNEPEEQFEEEINMNEQTKMNNHQRKKSKSIVKKPIESILKERKNTDCGTRVKFSVISSMCFFGDEEILMEKSNRDHMAKILSTTAKFWVLDRKSFSQFLKSQRTFKMFKRQCRNQLELKDSRLEKISSTIKKEEDKFLTTLYHPKHPSNVTKVHQNIEQALAELMKSSDDELYNQNTEENNQNYLHNLHNNMGNYRQTQIANDHSFIKEESNDEKLVNLFSRSNYVVQIEHANSKKMKIFKEISQKGLGYNGIEQSSVIELEPSMNDLNDENGSSTRRKHIIPYQKNLLFQPVVMNGIKKGQYRDPFKAYNDTEPISTKQKKQESLTNLPVSSQSIPLTQEKQRKSIFSGNESVKSISTFSTFLEKKEKKQHQSMEIVSKDKLEKLMTSKDKFIEDQLQQTRKSSYFNQSSLSSTNQINELREDKKDGLVPIQTYSNSNFSSDSLNQKEKNKFLNIQEFISESRQQLQTISEHEIKQYRINKPKKIMKKFKTDIENESLYNSVKDIKPSSKKNSSNVLSSLLLHETEDDEYFKIHSKTTKNSSHSLVSNASIRKGSLKLLDDKCNKNYKLDNNIYDKENLTTNSQYIRNKAPRSSFQEQFNHQSNRNIISALNLNATEHAFDSFKVLLTEEDKEDKEIGQNFSSMLASPPLYSLKHINGTPSSQNIHMDKLRKQNQNKQLANSCIMNKIKNSNNKIFLKNNYNNQNQQMKTEVSDLSIQSLNTNQLRFGENNIIKNTFSVKKF